MVFSATFTGDEEDGLTKVGMSRTSDDRLLLATAIRNMGAERLKEKLAQTVESEKTVEWEN